MVKQSFAGPTPPPLAPPVAMPILAAVARKTAAALFNYARAQRQAARNARHHGTKPPVREFGVVRLHGRTYGAVYEDGKLIAVIPDVGRM